MEITAIKQQLTLSQVLQYYNLKPDKHLRLCCPFHEDKTPSLQLYYKTHTAYCFSTNCKTAGKAIDVIDFIMLMDKSSKHDALKKAATMVEGTAIKANPGRAEFLGKMFTYFKNAVYNSGPAKEYLKQRGLDYMALDIGYNSAQFHHAKRKEEELIKSCVQYGLLIDLNLTGRTGEKAYKPFAKHSLVFALKNKQNQVTGLYFRNIQAPGEENNKVLKDRRHFYLKDRQGLYPSYPKENTVKLLLTESIIDAATLLQQPEISQQYELLALYGTNGLTEQHMQAITTLQSLEEIIFFLNGDQPGREAIKQHGSTLQELMPEIIITYVETPEGEDVNSLNQSYEDKSVFKHLIEQRKFFSSSEQRALAQQLTLEKVTKQKEEEEKQEEIKEQQPLIHGELSVASPEQITYESEDLKITIWGGIEKDNLSRMKVNLHVRSKADKYRTFRDDTNLYSHQAVQKLTKALAETLYLSSTKVAATLTDLTEQLEQYRLTERAQQLKALVQKPYEMTTEEKEAAISFLKGANLVDRTQKLISRSGLIGEERNGLLLFFLYLSRLSDEPLHAIIFGKSGSGKTYLQTKVSECLPEESVRTVTSLTENTLYYSPKEFWKHKVLLIEDLEGVYNAFLPLREFMSKQSISKLTTDKDAKGNNVQKVLTVEGPICVSGATTKESIYEDNANRSYLIHIDESSSHMNQVMQYQRNMQAGLVNEKQQESARKLLKNAQRLLIKIKVINRFAPQLVIPDTVFKKLRTNMHYLRLIEIITLYNQHQREVKRDESGKSYVETALQDIEVANELIKESLLRKSDELSGELRDFFELLKRNSKPEEGFYARDIRKALRMHPMKLSRYLFNLEQRGYVKRIGGNRNTGYEYQITVWDEYQVLQQQIAVLDSVLEILRQKEITDQNPASQPLHNGFTTEDVKLDELKTS